MKLLYLLIIAMAFAQPSTNIFLYDLELVGTTYSANNKTNLTPRNSYNNQPSFSADGKLIFYTSMRDKKQTDLYMYEINTRQDTQLTHTETSEYSPLQTPDGNHISTVVVEKDNAQRLWKYSLKTKKGNRLMMTDKIGYHCWLNDKTVAVFQLTEPFSIKYVDIKTEKEIVISENIGRSLYYNAKEDLFNFMHKADGKTFITSVTTKGKILNKKILMDEQSTDFFVSNKGHYFTGIRNKLYSFIPKENKWLMVNGIDLKKISRIAVSPDSKRIAIVSEI